MLDISWKPPDLKTQRGPILGYIIKVTAVKPNYVMPLGCTWSKHEYDVKKVNDTTTSISFLIQPVFYYYVYQVNVTAYNNAGEGAKSYQDEIYFPARK